MFLDGRLLHETRKIRWVIGGTILAGFAGGIGAILQAREISRIIAGVFLEHRNLAEVMPWMLGLLLIILGRAVAVFASESAGARAAARIKTDLRGRLLKHWMALGPAATQSRDSGELVSIALQGVEALDAYFSQYLPQIALAGLIPLLVLGFVFPLDPLSGIILLVTGPLIPLFMYLIGANTERLAQRQFKSLSRMSGYLLDTIQGLQTLKELGRSRDQAGRIGAVSEEYRSATLRVLRVSFLSALALEMLGTLGTAMIAVQVGLRLLYGGIPFEQAFFLLVIAPDFYLPLRTLGQRFHAAASGVAAAGKIFETLEQPAQPAPGAALEGSQAVSRDPALNLPIQVEFREVSFGYPGRKEDALQNLSLRIRPGELTALVGASGSGKSTVAQILLGFIRAGSGEVLVNGVPLDGIPIREWRSRISWVPQQPRVFTGTIGANLRIASEDAGSEAMLNALGRARLDTWVRSLDAGLETRVGEGGARLSGGQAQRLALARAFLRNAPLLVMDEPTAHLDPMEEKLLEEAIRELCQGRSVLVIAHRLATIYRADQILVMDQGRVVENGRHGELLKRGGMYTRLAGSFGGEP